MTKTITYEEAQAKIAPLIQRAVLAVINTTGAEVASSITWQQDLERFRSGANDQMHLEFRSSFHVNVRIEVASSLTWHVDTREELPVTYKVTVNWGMGGDGSISLMQAKLALYQVVVNQAALLEQQLKDLPKVIRTFKKENKDG